MALLQFIFLVVLGIRSTEQAQVEVDASGEQVLLREPTRGGGQQTQEARIDWVRTLLAEQHVLPVLYAAEKLGLFATLSASRGLHFAELVHKLKVSPKGLDALLVTLVTGGFVTQSRDTMKLTCLPHGGLPEEVMADVLGWQVMGQRQLHYLPESVQEGKAAGMSRVFGDYESLYLARSEMPEIGDLWDKFMESKNVFLDQLVDQLVRHSKSAEDDAKFMLLDWCGNTGYNSVRAVKKYPKMHATILDLPSQCEKAAELAKKSGLEDRMDTLPVNLLDGSFKPPRGQFDGVLMTHTVREWTAEHVHSFFDHVHDVLKPGGSVIMDMVTLRRMGEFPLVGAVSGLFHAYFLAATSDHQHEHMLAEVKDWLTAAGFVDIEWVVLYEGCSLYNAEYCYALMARRG